MKKFSHLLTAGLVFGSLTSFPALGAPLDDKIEAFKNAIKEDVAKEQEKDADGPLAPVHAKITYLMADLDQIPSELADPNQMNNAQAEISQILAGYFSPKVQKAGQDLAAEVRRLRKIQVESAASKMNALLAKNAEAVKKAKQAGDLNGTLSDLHACIGNRYGYNAESPLLFQKVSSAYDFTKLWQDYLFHGAKGDSSHTLSDLQSLIQSEDGLEIIPRSQLLERLQAATTGGQTVGGTRLSSAVVNALRSIRTSSDLEPALQNLKKLSAEDPGAADAYQKLSDLYRVNQDIKSAEPGSIDLEPLLNNEVIHINPRVQELLVTSLLKKYFDSYRGPAPAPNASPQSFLNSVVVDAVDRQDWALVRKARAAQSYLTHVPTLAALVAGSASAGVDNLLAGLNQETAGQYLLAVVSYQNALKVSDTLAMANLIGIKLSAIKKEHPQEYADGMQNFVSSQVPKSPIQDARNDKFLAPRTAPATGLHSEAVNSQASPALSLPAGGLTNAMESPFSPAAGSPRLIKSTPLEK